MDGFHKCLWGDTVGHFFDVSKESCPRGQLRRSLLLRLGHGFLNRELHGLDDKIHATIDPHYKIVGEEPMRESCDGSLGDLG